MAGFPEPDWLKHRIAFCDYRIGVRSNDHRPEAQLIAAALQEESAAARLLLGDVDGARQDLIEAGRRFVALGHARGLLLQALAGEPGQKDTGLFRRIIEAVRPLGEDRPYRSRAERIEGADPGRPQQWLYGFAAAALDTADEAGFWIDPNIGAIVRSLKETSSAVLSNGLSARDYIDGFLEEPDPAGESEALRFAFLHRRRLLRRAIEDRYHWERAMNVAAYVDFELVALLLFRMLRTPALLSADEFTDDFDAPVYEAAQRAFEWSSGAATA